MLEILKSLGCRVKYQDKTVVVDSSNITSNEIPTVLVKQMRSSIVLLGPLLGRTGKVITSYPGAAPLGSGLSTCTLRDCASWVQRWICTDR